MSLIPHRTKFWIFFPFKNLSPQTKQHLCGITGTYVELLEIKINGKWKKRPVTSATLTLSSFFNRNLTSMTNLNTKVRYMVSDKKKRYRDQIQKLANLQRPKDYLSLKDNFLKSFFIKINVHLLLRNTHGLLSIL